MSEMKRGEGNAMESEVVSIPPCSSLIKYHSIVSSRLTNFTFFFSLRLLDEGLCDFR